MAELDDVVQKVILEGDSELLESLANIGEKGSEAFKALSEAASGGEGGFTSLANALGAVEAALAAVVAGVTAFVEKQDEAVQRMAFLADAMGTTTEQVSGLEAAFAAAGVSTQTFERFATRLTTELAQQWPQITANVRTAATQQSQAQDQIVAATIRVRQAQNALSLGAEEDNQKIVQSNLRVEQAYTNLQHIIQDAAANSTRALQSVTDANLAVEAAQQRLATLQGNGPTDAQKKDLEIRQAQAALDDARQAAQQKQVALQRQAQEEAQKRAQAEAALADAQLARQRNIAELETAQLQRQNALAEAQDRLASATERAQQEQLKNIPAITNALQGIIDKNGDVARSIDLSQVSIQNLRGAIFNLAAVSNNGFKPTGLQAFDELVKVLSNDTANLISHDQQLALVQRAISQGMNQAGASAAELLAAIKHGPEYFNAFTDAASKHISTQEKGVKAAEDFKKALESFSQQVELTFRDLAVLASPALISFLNALKSSLTEDTGLLHLFVQGIETIGSAIAVTIASFKQLFDSIDFAIGNATGAKVNTLRATLLALALAVAAFASPWIGIPVLIALVVTAIGELSQNFAKATQAVSDFWDKVKTFAVDNPITRFWERLLDVITKVKNLIGNGQWVGAQGGGGGGNNATESPLDQPTPPISRAHGGPVDGPGTTTSDSIFARLSRGEFVVKAAAVQNYGAGLFHALNNMSFPGFAAGGLVPAPARLSAHGPSMQPTSTLNLSIDGRSFNGLRGPKSTIDDLTSFAISRQASRAGNNPSWMK